MDKIDLHMHSAYSGDADFPVLDVINLAEKNNLSVISITDHNSSKSVHDAINHCTERQLCFITGIEIDCAFHGRNYHLLGYGYNKDSRDFDVIERNFIQLQTEATPIKIDKLKKLGFFMDETALYKDLQGEVPQEESMAELILHDDRNNDNSLLLPYRAGGGRADMPLVNFFWDFFGIGKPCHVEITFPELSDIVDVIRDNSGIPIIAHIGANIQKEHLSTIESMCKKGVMGVEVFSSYHSSSLSKQLFDYCQTHTLFTTCGSDFHGKNKPNIAIGSCEYNRQELTNIRKFIDSVHVY